MEALPRGGKSVSGDLALQCDKGRIDDGRLSADRGLVLFFS